MRFLGPLSLLLWAGTAKAHALGDLAEIQQRLTRIELDAQALQAAIKPPPPPGLERVAQRLAHAQLLHGLGRNEEAATAALEIVDKFPRSPVMSDALYLVGQALHDSGDHANARRYLERAVERGPREVRYQEALQRLIELALKTGDMSEVEGHLAKLSAVPSTRQQPSVPYVRAKYAYFRGRLDEAARGFLAIEPSSPFSMQARYFAGAVRVAQRRPKDALPLFASVLDRPPRTDRERDIHDLARMALGRVHLELGQLDKAAAQYGAIGEKSRHFNDALYERAWTFIRAKEAKQALATLEALLAREPAGPRTLEVRMLIGSLEVRTGQLERATAHFERTRNDLDAMNKVLVSSLPPAKEQKAHFRRLCELSPDRFDFETFLPPEVAGVAATDPAVTAMSHLQGDVGEMRRMVAESEQLLGRLEGALRSGGRARMFPDLDRVYVRAIAVSGLFARTRVALGGILRAHATALGTPGEVQRLEAIAGRREPLEAELRRSALTEAEVRSREEDQRRTYQDAEHRLFEVRLLIQQLAAELVAIEKFQRDTRAQKKGQDDKYERDRVKLREEIAALEAEHERTRAKVSAELDRVAERASQRDEEVRHGLAAILEEEARIVAGAAARAPAQPDLQRALAAAEQARRVSGVLEQIGLRLQAVVDDRLVEVRRTLEEERVRLHAYRSQLDQLVRRTVELGAQVALTSYKGQSKRIYEMLAASELGLINVAWAHKQSHSDRAEQLRQDRTRELRAIDEQYDRSKTPAQKPK